MVLLREAMLFALRESYKSKFNRDVLEILYSIFSDTCFHSIISLFLICHQDADDNPRYHLKYAHPILFDCTKKKQDRKNSTTIAIQTDDSRIPILIKTY